MNLEDDFDDCFQFDQEMELIKETDKAILVREAGIPEWDVERDINEFWIPKSVIVESDIEEVGDEGTLTVKGWWARSKDLTDD